MERLKNSRLNFGGVPFRAWMTGTRRMVHLGPLEFIRTLKPKPTERGEEAFLMPSSGLKDRNGQEIYHLDILHVPPFGNPVVCRYDPDNLAWMMGFLLFNINAEYLEIIGNVFERPRFDRMRESRRQFREWYLRISGRTA